MSGRYWLPFLPSLLFGVAGALWVAIQPPAFERSQDAWVVITVAVLLAALLLAGSWLLERVVPSYRHGSRLVELALRRLALPRVALLALAAATSLGEELFFRGGLMQITGIWGQALLFGALHPISRRAWAYTAYTALAGLLFGYAVLVTGSLWSAIIAHFLVNLHGLLSGRRRA